MKNVHFTHDEIVSQPEAWNAALTTIQQNKDAITAMFAKKYDQIVFTGCGSTYYLSLSAAALKQELTGRSARAVPGGELLLNPKSYLTPGKSLLVAVSRSGSTTETVRAVEKFREEKRGNVIVITNYGDQPLTKLGDLCLVIEAGQEKSVAQTRSFASMLVAATGLCAAAVGNGELLAAMEGLPRVGERLIKDYSVTARQLGENLEYERVYFLGNGFRYGLACEANLKMKEMTLTHSEPFHFMEFRHGPMSMVTQTTVIAGLCSDKNRNHEMAVLKEMDAMGARIFTLGESDTEVTFKSGIPESICGVLYLPVLQLMALYRAYAKGLNPDRPAHLTAVVKLDL